MPRTSRTAAKAIAGHSISDLNAPIEVRRHPGARRLTLRVSRTRRAVIVTLPIQCDLDEAGSFLHRNMAWVRERLDQLPSPVPFRDGAFMPLRGETHRVAFTGNASGRGVVRQSAAEPYAELQVCGQAEHAPRRLGDWLVKQARTDLEDRVALHCGRLGLKASRISVRDQTSRWGSCSTTGALSFSWRLILAPRHILDYVAAHEVAHLAEMNQGPNFWALVRRTMPDMDEARRWLQIYGMDLHRYGPAIGGR
jgi:predicted metal-dependent hydrolase